MPDPGNGSGTRKRVNFPHKHTRAYYIGHSEVLPIIGRPTSDSCKGFKLFMNQYYYCIVRILYRVRACWSVQKLIRGKPTHLAVFIR